MKHSIFDDFLRYKAGLEFKAFAVLFISAISCAAYAIDGWTVSTKITEILSYNQFGSGDVAFSVENPTVNCPSGYWITKSDPGFGANFAIIQAAYLSKTSVRVVGQPEQKWAGSTGIYCKVYVISQS